MTAPTPRRRFLALAIAAFLLGCSWLTTAIAFLLNPGNTYGPPPWSEKATPRFWYITADTKDGLLHKGDVILAIDGDESVRFTGSLYKLATLPPGRAFRLRVDRQGAILEFSYRRRRVLATVRDEWIERLATAALYLLVATFIALKKPESLQARLAWFAGLALSWFSLESAVFAVGFSNTLPLWLLPPLLLGWLNVPAIYLFLESFPEIHPRTPAWRAVRWVVFAASALLAVANAPQNLIAFHFRAPWAYQLALGFSLHFRALQALPLPALAVADAGLLAVLVRNYRAALSRDARRRIRLVAATFGFAIVWQVACLALAHLGPSSVQSLAFRLQRIPLAFAPLALAYAVVRYRVLDIEVIVRRTVRYLLARRSLEVLIALPFLIAAGRAVANPEIPVRHLADPPIVWLALIGFGITGLFLRRRALDALDRRFFREEFDREKLLDKLLAAIPARTTIDSALQLVQSELEGALHPEWIEISYVPAGAPVELPPAPPEGLIEPIGTPRHAKVGYLLLGPRLSEQPYTPYHRQLLRNLAIQIGFVYDLQLLAIERVEAVNTERNRMARELHDTLAQGFAGISLHLESARTLVQDSPETAGEHLRQAQLLARLSLAEARRSVHGLRSGESSANDLAHRLRELARILSSPALGIEVAIRGDAAVPEPIGRNLLRIAQESVANAIKHSGAGRVRIELSTQPRSDVSREPATALLQLSVSDDGKGFDSGAAPPAGSFGLTGIRERAAEMGAHLELLSEGGVTVRVTVEIPV